MVLLFLLAGWGLFGSLPDHTVLENPDTDLATEIITADGVTIGKFYRSGGNRTPVTYDDLPQHLVDALVSTEDERFWDHSGIDGYGTARAFSYLGQRGGASTITQQLAKLYFTDKRSKNTIERGIQKIKEWIIATRLEKQYTKEEIITQYLNTMGFLKGAIGIRSAANIYFGKEPKDLTLEESAVFVAMLKNPRQFNPAREVSKKKSFTRRNQVFVQMVRNGKLTEQEKDSLRDLPIKLDFSPEGHNHGMGTYFREELRNWLTDWASNTKNKATGENYDIYDDGLKVNVTIDSRMQRYAEEAVKAHMANVQREFDRQTSKLKTAPFRSLTEKQINSTLDKAMKRSDRWRQMKKAGKSEKEIIASFNKKTDMSVFSWEAPGNEIDTMMTPRDSIRYYKKFLHAGMMSLEPQTGHIKAWVGGINHKHFKYDHVKIGERQVGSTFKPFVYAMAIDQLKYSPCKKFSDSKYTIPAGRHNLVRSWTPKNSGGGYGNNRTLKNALAKSVNTISARLIDEVGPQPIIDLASKLGIDTRDFPVVPSLALGVADASVYEMVGAYGAFANQGVFNPPVLVTNTYTDYFTKLCPNTCSIIKLVWRIFFFTLIFCFTSDRIIKTVWMSCYHVFINITA